MKKLAAFVVFGIGLSVWVLGVVLGHEAGYSISDHTFLLSLLPASAAGLFLAVRVAGNPFGWLLLCGPPVFVAGIVLADSGRESLGDLLIGLGLLLAVSALYLFPDGRIPARIWVWMWVGGMVVTNVISRLFDSDLRFGLEGFGMAVVVVGALGSLIHRVVIGDHDTRRQIGFPVLVLAIGFLAGFTLDRFPQLDQDWGEIVVPLLVTVGFPIALAVSVTHYRLYEIDRVISRTIGYTLLIASLGLVFAGLAVWVPQSLGINDPLFVAGATLAVAALFTPLRQRIQGSVDRRFNRSKYDAERVIDDFAGTLSDRVDPDDVVEGWVGVVSETMQPETVGVWVR